MHIPTLPHTNWKAAKVRGAPVSSSPSAFTAVAHALLARMEKAVRLQMMTVSMNTSTMPHMPRTG
jgi:hypothetical protein